MREDSDDFINFYYNAGLYAGEELDIQSSSDRSHFVNRFDRFVKAKGGKHSFHGPEDAVRQFLKQYRKESYGRKRH